MTPEQQEKIEEAAEKLGHEQFDSWPASLERQAHINQTISDFKAGAEYILSHPEELERFAEWIIENKNTEYVDAADGMSPIWITEYLNSKTQQP